MPGPGHPWESQASPPLRSTLGIMQETARDRPCTTVVDRYHDGSQPTDAQPERGAPNPSCCSPVEGSFLAGVSFKNIRTEGRGQIVGRGEVAGSGRAQNWGKVF